jgi:hypothetical protein
VFKYFLVFLWWLNFSFIALWSDSIQGVISSYICEDLLCDVRYALFWRKFYFGESSILEKGLLRRKYIVLLHDRILRRCLSGPFDLWYHSILQFLCWCLSESPIYWWKRSIEVSHHHCLGVVCVFKSSSVWLMKLGVPTLGTLN